MKRALRHLACVVLMGMRGTGLLAPDVLAASVDAAVAPGASSGTTTQRAAQANADANVHSAVDAVPPGADLHPRPRPDGKKWRIAYVDSGDYNEYPRMLRAVVQGLAQLGWLSIAEIPAGLDSGKLWAFLGAHAQSDYIQFVPDAWWQPAQTDPRQRPIVRQAIATRLAERADIDLIIAMGTWAGQDMAALGAPIPTVVASASDPVAANIVQSAEDSGLDNLHARVEPQRYQRQLRLFHDIYPFKRLGLVYEDSPEGRIYAGVEAAQEIARTAGFAIVACHTPSNGISQAEAVRGVLACYRRLAPDIDAAYVTVHRGVTPNSIRAVADILSDAAVPSFSMLGSEQVQEGILLSIAQADASYVGRFYARTIARILNGARPRSLNQVWIDPLKLAINVQTARLIGFDPPIEALFSADELFSSEATEGPRRAPD